MNHRINRELVLQALLMAMYQRWPDGDLKHHSHRASQYASRDFQALLDDHGIDCSMSGTGNGYDDSAVENSFALLKRKRVHQALMQYREICRTR